jgi:hypothetical protein
VNKIHVKKATRVDDILPLLLKLALPSTAKPLAGLVNKSIEKSVFPNSLKIAKVCLIHKKNSCLDIGNYRPVSVLQAVSKLFERAIHM